MDKSDYSDPPFVKTVGHSSVVLGHGQQKAFAEAQEGVPESAGRTYGLAAAFIRAGDPIPEPVATWIADRLDEVGSVLRGERGGDVRKELPAAVNPHPTGMRQVGRRPDESGDLQAIAEWVVDTYELHTKLGKAPRGHKTSLIASGAELSGHAFDSMRRAVAQVEKERADLNGDVQRSRD